MRYKIEKSKIDDSQAIVDILRSSILQICSPYYMNNQKVIDKWLANKNVENVSQWIIQTDNYSVTAFTDENKVAGFGLASLKINFANEGRILLCYISPLHIRRGVGTLIMTKLETILKNCNVQSLLVDSSLSAINFYLARGYQSRYFNEEHPMTLAMSKLAGSTNFSQRFSDD